MKVCGVDLNSNDANVCLLALDDELFQLPDFRARRISLTDSNSTGALRHFQQTFAKLMHDYKVDKVVIRQRPMKGKFAGGAIGFKLEAALELLSGVQVIIMPPTEIKAALKDSQMYVEFSETGLKGSQKSAFETALAYMSQHL